MFFSSLDNKVDTILWCQHLYQFKCMLTSSSLTTLIKHENNIAELIDTEHKLNQEQVIYFKQLMSKLPYRKIIDFIDMILLRAYLNQIFMIIEVISITQLSKHQEEQIKTYVRRLIQKQYLDTVIYNQINTSIIGGYIIKTRQHIFDLSLKTTIYNIVYGKVAKLISY